MTETLTSEEVRAFGQTVHKLLAFVEEVQRLRAAIERHHDKTYADKKTWPATPHDIELWEALK